MANNLTKKRVDLLFLLHSTCSALCGTLAFLLPHVFEWFFIHHGEKLVLWDNQPEQKIEHLTVRLYGAIIVGQAWICWHARKSTDAHMRRSLVQGYWFVFTLSTLALLRAQTTGGDMSGWNWINILLFLTLSLSYGWFAFAERITVFEGLGKMTV